MDISARAFSLADRPQRAIWVTSVRMRREDRSSISSYLLAGEDARQLASKEAQSLPDGNAALQQESADLIDDAGALADQPLPYPVQRL